MIIAADLDFWNDAFDRPLTARFGPAPRDITDYVTLVNTAAGDPRRAQPVEVESDFLRDAQDAVAQMPTVVRRLLGDVFLGVYFARELGSSAITDIVVSPAGAFLGIVTALDVDAFADRGANAWATWKENTPFRPSPSFALEVRIEHAHDDNRRQAIQYLLLHEFGHVLAAGRPFLPDWWLPSEQIKQSGDYSFLPISWSIGTNASMTPLPRNDFALRRRVAYYTGALLDGAELLPVYEALQATDFPTLYAAVSPYEDFAESFASYVHTVLMDKPFEIRIMRDGQVVLRPDLRWSDARYAEKFTLLQRFLGSAPLLPAATA